ncbi:hypothetical protein V6N12_011831 [Hibiscus sabdariffa]|uniref:Uncharacterized protein n=1 Tax=Hibiscus sabdariffa TaxID=183260 RepID=A0ABR2CGC8_9ROSI
MTTTFARRKLTYVRRKWSARKPSVLADGLLSGRPPDPPPATALLPAQDNQPGQQILSGESLERPRSPISMDLQCQCKKVRGDVMQDPIVVSDAMVTDGEMRGLDIDSEKEESRVSYAKVLSMPGKGTHQDQIGLGDSVCDPHKILVFDEDCVVDKSGKFPKIEFSERVHQQLDLAMRNNRLANSDKGNEIREDANGENALFGPWMTVDTRRKRGYNGASSSRRNGKSGGRNDTNRFAALADDQTVTMEEQATPIVFEAGEVSPRRNPSQAVRVGAEKLVVNGLLPRAAGSVSDNSDKSGAFEKAVILPMVEGQHVQGVAQSSAGIDKRHAAISLLEKGHGKSAAEGVVLGRGRGGKKGGREGLHQGLKVRKPPDTRTTSRALMNEWVEGVHNQLTAIAEQSAIDPGRSIRASVNQEGKLVPSVSIPTGIGVRTSMSGVESDGVTDGSVADH